MKSRKTETPKKKAPISPKKKMPEKASPKRSAKKDGQGTPAKPKKLKGTGTKKALSQKKTAEKTKTVKKTVAAIKNSVKKTKLPANESVKSAKKKSSPKTEKPVPKKTSSRKSAVNAIKKTAVKTKSAVPKSKSQTVSKAKPAAPKKAVAKNTKKTAEGAAETKPVIKKALSKKTSKPAESRSAPKTKSSSTKKIIKKVSPEITSKPRRTAAKPVLKKKVAAPEKGISALSGKTAAIQASKPKKPRSIEKALNIGEVAVRPSRAKLKIFLPPKKFTKEDAAELFFGSLPEEFGENSLIALAVDPNTVFADWEIIPLDLVDKDGELNLRFYDVTGIEFNDWNANAILDVSINRRIGSGFFEIRMPGRDVIVAAGVLSPVRGFMPIIRSGVVSFPDLLAFDDLGIVRKLFETDLPIGY